MPENTRDMKVIGFTGASGSGKTTLIERVIPALVARGLRVSTVKHSHHSVDLDQPGKDTYRHRAGGAHEVVLANSARFAILHEYRDAPEWELDELMAHMDPVDVVIVEGFKRHGHPKIEVYRPAHGKPPRAFEDPTLIAVATDGPLPDAPAPVLDLNDAGAVADFVVDHLGLTVRHKG